MKKEKTRDMPAHVLSVSKLPVSPRSKCGPKLKYRNSVHCPVLHLSVSLFLFELSCIHGNLCSPPFLYISRFSVFHIFLPSQASSCQSIDNHGKVPRNFVIAEAIIFP